MENFQGVSASLATLGLVKYAKRLDGVRKTSKMTVGNTI